MTRNPDQSVNNRKNNTNRFEHLEAELNKVIEILKDYLFNKNRQVAIAKTKPFERFSSDLRLSNLEFFILLTDRDAVTSMIAEMKQKKLNEDNIEELAALKKLTSVLTESHIEKLTEVKTWLHYNQKLSESYLNRPNPIGPSENYDHNLSELANGIKPDKLRYKTHTNLDILPDPNRTQYLNDCKTVIAEKIKADLTYIDSLISEFLTEKSKAPTQPPEPPIYVKDKKKENMLDQIGRAINSVGKLIAGSETRSQLTETEKDSPSAADQRVVEKKFAEDFKKISGQGNETNKAVQRTTYSNCHHPPAAMKATIPFRGTDIYYSEEQINNDLKLAKINSKKNKSIAVLDPSDTVPKRDKTKITWSNPVRRTPTQGNIGMHHSDWARFIGEDIEEKRVNPASKPARYI